MEQDIAVWPACFIGTNLRVSVFLSCSEKMEIMFLPAFFTPIVSVIKEHYFNFLIAENSLR